MRGEGVTVPQKDVWLNFFTSTSLRENDIYIKIESIKILQTMPLIFIGAHKRAIKASFLSLRFTNGFENYH